MLRRIRLVALVVAGTSALLQAAALFAVSTPAIVAELDAGKLKGAPTCLAWSQAEGEFYLQTVDDDGKMRHFIVRTGTEAQALDAQPEWAVTYWKWKSARSVPG